MSTAETGSTVSMIGRLARSAPALYALADNSSPVPPSAISAQGCQ
jgi:hypothetical protein